MAWEDTPKADPVMEGKKGVISWNAATQAMLGNPISVEVFYDASTGRIGFRGAYYYGHLRVMFGDEYEYSVDCTPALAALDLPNNWTATPAPLPEGEYLPDSYNAGAGEIYIDVPVEIEAVVAATAAPTRKRTRRK